jgi:hypothetical protein
MLPTLFAAALLDGSAFGFVGGWGTLSLINAGLAQSKNHSGLLWWLLSLLLGPLATFVIVAFLDKRPHPLDRL